MQDHMDRPEKKAKLARPVRLALAEKRASRGPLVLPVLLQKRRDQRRLQAQVCE